MAVKAYYSASSTEFLADDPDRILGVLTTQHHHALEGQQRFAWIEQLHVLGHALQSVQGALFLECYIPRMGKRADAVFVTMHAVFVLEFKVGASEHHRAGLDQVEDYALDLKNFHEGSHDAFVVPILVSTNACSSPVRTPIFASDRVAQPLTTNSADLALLLETVDAACSTAHIELNEWTAAGYKPTPTIVEAAQTLYRTHSVADISRSDSGAKNLQSTSASVSRVIDEAGRTGTKAICFVTGVPGSGKTLAGLNIATRRSEEHADEHAVFLSGNGPLVTVLREALARDKAAREGMSKASAEREVRSFVQNIHHFRDHYVGNVDVPVEKVVVFDEAQRAWTRHQASSFMQRKRGHSGFDMSEPEFLISVMNRHSDWCTIVCLVGGGQEINTGEAGISEWIDAVERSYPHWNVFISPQLADGEYAASKSLAELEKKSQVSFDAGLHLAASMRSFRAETVSDFVKSLLDLDLDEARLLL